MCKCFRPSRSCCESRTDFILFIAFYPCFMHAQQRMLKIIINKITYTSPVQCSYHHFIMIFVELAYTANLPIMKIIDVLANFDSFLILLSTSSFLDAVCER